MLMDVVWVHWSTKEHIVSGEVHAFKLIEVRGDRTVEYRRAWNLSRYGILSLLAMAVLLALDRFGLV
jgi:hypothetical protein